MYIPEFWIGFMAGAISCIVLFVIIGIISGKKKKR